MRNPCALIITLLSCLLTLSCADGKRRQMEQVIIEADSMNRNYVPMTSDSLLTIACDFYDRHGTPNERMKAHYLLGCAYRDMGEAPHAVDCYHQAAACADTAAKDCDYRTLGCVYSQMGDVYNRQLLLSNAIQARHRATYYAFLAGDTVNGIYDYMITAGVYLLQNKNDSAEQILNNSVKLYERFGKEDEALETSMMMMHVLCNQPKRKMEFKRLIDKYDSKSKYFDEHHELSPQKRLFYYYKGRYFEMENQLDSAEFYYRKIHRANMSFQQKDPMYRGLLSVFRKLNKADSIAKYAQLYCETNDSSVVIKNLELTARLAASYRYNTIQKEAMENEQEANHARTILIIVVAVIILLSVIAFFCWLQYKKRKGEELNQMKSKYIESVDIYNRNLETLRIIDETRKTTIAELQQQLTSVEEELRGENDQLKETINVLRKQANIQQDIELMQRYLNTPIVRRIRGFIDTPLAKLENSDKDELLSTTSKFFPSLLKDLQQANVNILGMLICVLVVIQVNPGSIANMLGISKQQVANIKNMIGGVLFGDHSARSLYKNLMTRYNIYVG